MARYYGGIGNFTFIIMFIFQTLFIIFLLTMYINSNSHITINVDKYGEDDIKSLQTEIDMWELKYNTLEETKQVVCEYKDGNFVMTLLGGFIVGILACFYAVWVFGFELKRREDKKENKEIITKNNKNKQ